MSYQERSLREKPRHPEVPEGALNQKQAMRSLGITSPYWIDKLATACAEKGAPEVFIPENNAPKYGKWYPLPLVDAMREKNAERAPDAPDYWQSSGEISINLKLEYNTTRRLLERVMRYAFMEKHFGRFTSGNGLATEFFDELCIRAAIFPMVTEQTAMDLLGIINPKELHQLATQCADDGAAPVITLESDSAQDEKWYDLTLLEAIQRKQQAAVALGTPPLISQQLDVPSSTPQTDITRRPKRLRTSKPRWTGLELMDVLPPAASPDDLLPEERTDVASADVDLMSTWQSFERDLTQALAAVYQITNHGEKQSLNTELAIIMSHAETHRRHLQVLPRDIMRPRVLGLIRALEKVKTTLRGYSVVGDD